MVRTVPRRGSVRVERAVRQSPVWERAAACPGTLAELGFEKESGWNGCGNYNAGLSRADGIQAPKDLGEEVMPNEGVNRRYRSGALMGDEESECLVVVAGTRGSVRVERLVRLARLSVGLGPHCA